MTKTFTTTDGRTHVCESTSTIACPRDIIDGKPTMKLIEVGATSHTFVFGHPADLCDADPDHTLE
jgi:hypothetical protein